MDSPRVAIWLVGTDDPGQAAVTALLVAVGAVMVMLMAYWLEAPLWLAALSLGGWFLLLRLGVQLGDRSLRRVGKLERQTLEETLKTARRLLLPDPEALEARLREWERLCALKMLPAETQRVLQQQADEALEAQRRLLSFLEAVVQVSEGGDETTESDQ